MAREVKKRRKAGLDPCFIEAPGHDSRRRDAQGRGEGRRWLDVRVEGQTIILEPSQHPIMKFIGDLTGVYEEGYLGKLRSEWTDRPRRQ